MSWKKKKIKKDKNRKRNIFFFLGGTFLILLFLLLCFSLIFVKKWDKFEEVPRASSIDKVQMDDDRFESVGWLRVQGTNIDLPVIAADLDYRYDPNLEFPVELDSFAWSLNYDNEFHNQIKIMGHNIFNLSDHPKKNSKNFKRFEELMSFVYYDFAKENLYIQYSMDGKEYVYKIFAAGFHTAGDYTSFPLSDEYDKDDMKNYLSLVNDYSIYDYDVDVNEDDSIIYVVTCTRMMTDKRDMDFFISGRLLRKDEKIEYYTVKKKDSYNKVEKVLKGDD